MGINRRAAKRDGNEAEIIAALRDIGCLVDQLSGDGTPDLLVSLPGIDQNILLEVKAEKGKLTPKQEAWHARWYGQKAIVHTAQEAIDVVMRIREDEWDGKG